MDNQTETLIQNKQDDIGCEEMIKLLEDFYNINQIQSSLSSIILRQRSKIDSITDNIENSEISTLNGLTNLEIAKKYSFKYTPIIVGSLLGMALTGPTGLLLGLKTASIATAMSGGILGGWFGYKIQK
jgi:hypothetical protein